MRRPIAAATVRSDEPPCEMQVEERNLPVGRRRLQAQPIGLPRLRSLDGRGYRNLGRLSRIDRRMYVVMSHRVALPAGRVHPACASKEGIANTNDLALGNFSSGQGGVKNRPGFPEIAGNLPHLNTDPP